ncbi:transposable element Tcb1 transposase [Trichonephila clavipes]|nr:transposable element Tcb1 transposase [Trichonephila clavipes]
MKLSLLMRHPSVCNTTMVGFESGDTMERGCRTVAFCTATLVLHPVLWRVRRNNGRSHPPQCTTSLSARTIERRLQQSGLTARRPLLGLPLTQNHRRLRRQWSDERRMWTAEWNEVVFTDESRICNTTMFGFQSRDTVERMPWNSCVMHRHLVLHRVLWFRAVLISFSHSSRTHCRYFKTANATSPRC